MKAFFVCAIIFLLSGCESNNKKIVDLQLRYITKDSAPEPSVNKNAQAQLAEAATAVNASLHRLSEVQLATHPGVKLPAAPNPERIGMAQMSSLDWMGPVRPLLTKMAQASHYRLRVIGKTPLIPVIVTVSASNEPLASILRDVRYQVAKKARIKVYPRSKIIELRYLLG